MGWIKDRIDAEYRKHYKVTGGCDWSLIAEKKILTELKSSVLWNSSLEELWKDDEWSAPIRKKRSERLKGNTIWLGRKHSEISKQKNREADRTGIKNSQYGTCWITNEKESKKIHKGDLIPEGWRLGRTLKQTKL